jgi:peptidoglycan L-alanyl-D-glutamate endopeptidase CwlK
MPAFSERSKSNLKTAHPDLQRLFNEVVKYWDCAVIEGYRGPEEQHEAFINGKSKLDWPNGKHNKLPSLAVDVAPCSIDFNDIHRIYCFAGFVLGIAKMMGIKIRWGGDWDSDTEVKDNKFNDLVHFEVIPEQRTTDA